MSLLSGAPARVYARLSETVVLLDELGGPPIARYRELTAKTPELDDLERWQAVLELEEQGLLQRVGNGRLCIDLSAAKHELARLEGRLVIPPGPRSRLSALA